MSETENLKNKTLSGFTWKLAQKFLGQLFHFIVTVILARLLVPEDYGVVALASMFNVLVGIFINGSMDAALIQKKNADELDYNTVFYSSLFMSFVIYGVVYVGSPYVAKIYNNELICPIMRTLALTMPIGALSMVQNATISRKMQFQKYFYATLVGQIVSAFVGITMAYKGYGPWALVAQAMISSITNTLVLFFMVSWHPKLMFSFERFKGLFSFAWKKTVAGFIGTLCAQLKGYLIGYKYSTADLAFYNRGEGLPNLFMHNINNSINGVLFPALSKLQNNPDAIKRGIRRSMMTSSYILSPIFIGLAALSNQIVPVLYSSKWNPSIPFMVIACFTACVSVLNSANLQTLYAIGRSDEVLKLEIYKKPVMLIIIAITIFISPLAISAGMFIYSIYGLLCNTLPNKKYIGYSIRDQINDVAPGIVLSLIMGLVVYIIGLFIPNVYLSLVIQIIIGIAFYISISHIMNLESYLYVRGTLNDFIQRNFNRR